MNITIKIREIANGVIVTADRDQNNSLLFGISTPREWHYPTKEAAFDDLDSIAAEAWQRQEEREKMTVRFRRPGFEQANHDDRPQDGSAEATMSVGEAVDYSDQPDAD